MFDLKSRNTPRFKNVLRAVSNVLLSRRLQNVRDTFKICCKAILAQHLFYELHQTVY